MRDLIVNIVILILALLLASLAYFNDKNLKKGWKLFVLILVLASVVFGIYNEYAKYQEKMQLIKDNKNLANKLDVILRNDSILKADKDAVDKKLNEINTAISKSNLKFDSTNKIYINSGTVITSAKNVNAAPNYGHQQVGDKNTMVIKERELNKREQKEILDSVYSFIANNKLQNCVSILTAQGSTPKITNQILQLLISKGYEARIFGSALGSAPIKFEVENCAPYRNCAELTVGFYR